MFTHGTDYISDEHGKPKFYSAFRFWLNINYVRPSKWNVINNEFCRKLTGLKANNTRYENVATIV